MRVLVTGATSLLGRHTAARLLDAGHDVVVFQRTPCGLDGVVEHLGSVTDADGVDAAVAGVDGVIHLAAKVDPVGDWADFEAINVDGTATVHAAARAAGVSQFVYVLSLIHI